MKFLAILFLSVLLWSCSILKINKLSEVKELDKAAISYQLPQNRILVKLELEKVSFVAGPYSAYAKAFLELEGVQKTAESHWHIKDIALSTSSLPDTSELYIITGSINKIKAENVAQILNTSPKLEQDNFIEDFKTDFVPDFPELTLKKLLIEQSKTSYKTVTVDSVTKRVPITNTVVRNKTLEEMAKDASKTLLKIRKRKFRLISGLNEKLPEAKALEVMIKELNTKEKYYLSLFIGKEETETKKVSFSVLPVRYGKYEICSFDTRKGIVQAALGNSPISLNIEKSNFDKPDISEKYKQKENLLPYRKPQKVKVTVEQNQKPMISQEMTISQLND